MAGTLYIVATPIGNLEDMTPRAAATFGSVDFIAAEDTRVTLKLLNHLGLKKPLVSYYEHNLKERGRYILDRIQAGESCALCSDAGMPAISDPGEALVASCAAENIPVYVVPGPTAVISALAVSGLPTGRFTFEGFLSMNKRSRREHLLSVSQETRTMVFYEAPHKLRRTLNDFESVFGGERRLAVVRELTKIHEEVWRTTLREAAAHYRQHEPKGEFVLVVEGAKPKETREEYTLEEAAELARDFLQDGVSASEAAREAAKVSGLKKGDIYRLLG